MLANRSRAVLLAAALMIASFLALAATAPAAAQTLTGRVLEDGRDAPVSGALVSLLDRDGKNRAQTTADSLGRFTLAPPKAGEYIVEAARLGYETTRSPLLAMKADGTFPLELMMTPLPIGLEGLEVSVESEAEQLLRNYGQTPASLGDRWITHDDIDEMPLPVGPLEAIRNRHIAGVFVDECASIVMCGLCVTFQRAVTMAGANPCALTVLNGIHISKVDAQAINPYDLEAIVILKPTDAATIYGEAGGGGAVLMWTKTGGR